MGVLRDRNGKIIGTMDAPGGGACMLRTCNRTAHDRMRLGCEPRRSLSLDEALIDREDTEVADSAQARRIIEACAGTLDMNDMGLVLDMLAEAGKLNGSEIDSLKEKLNPSSETEMASDAAYKRFRERFPDCDRLKPADNYRPLPPPKYRPMTAAEDKAFNERFPNAGRLKTCL